MMKSAIDKVGLKDYTGRFKLLYTANICIGSTAEEQFFCVIFEKITRIYLLSQVHEKSAINTHFMCNLIAVYLCKFYTRRNVISTLG